MTQLAWQRVKFCRTCPEFHIRSGKAYCGFPREGKPGALPCGPVSLSEKTAPRPGMAEDTSPLPRTGVLRLPGAL